MKHFNFRSLALLALALVVATNVVALAGVAWNRSGEPGSTLMLSEREFGRPWGAFSRRGENSAMMLRIDWRALQRYDADSDSGYTGYSGYGSNTPDWLDEAKMHELGFNWPVAVEYDAQARSRYVARHSGGAEVFFVLELDGPAFRESIEQSRMALERAQRMVESAASNPDLDLKMLKNMAEQAEKDYQRAQTEYSRLFVVDAGLDAAALRARYADRAHYAVVQGRVMPVMRYRKKQETPGGYILGLSVGTINLPFGALPVAPGTRMNNEMKYELDIGWGQRYEPWILASRWTPEVPAPVQTRE